MLTMDLNILFEKQMRQLIYSALKVFSGLSISLYFIMHYTSRVI